MRIGYARVSTIDQNLDAQLDALKAAGCEYVYMEKRTAKDAKGRPELQKLVKKIRPLDVVVVTKLDRLARSTQDLLQLVQDLDRERAGLLSLSEPWADTTSPAGTLIITIMAGIAQFERGRILERCNEGRRAAKLRGARSGRKCALDSSRTSAALLMLQKGEHPKMVANVFGVNTATIYRMRARAAAAHGV
jgi:DNA invertase Pin-like site-specific DNA recombinase